MLSPKQEIKSKTILGQNIILVGKNNGKKRFWVSKISVLKSLDLKRFLCQEKFYVKTNLGPKTFKVQNIFDSKTLGPKKL